MITVHTGLYIAKASIEMIEVKSDGSSFIRLASGFLIFCSEAEARYVLGRFSE